MAMPRSHAKWTVQDDFVLMLLVGKHTFKEIALRLGRSESAVQRRSSHLKYSAQAERKEVREARRDQIEEALIRYLYATEADLVEYLPDLDTCLVESSLTS